jgi:hypothetical protein
LTYCCEPSYQIFFRSKEFKRDYNRLKREMNVALTYSKICSDKRRDVLAEKVSARLEKNELKKYKTLRDELVSLKFYFVSSRIISM